MVTLRTQLDGLIAISFVIQLHNYHSQSIYSRDNLYQPGYHYSIFYSGRVRIQHKVFIALTYIENDVSIFKNKQASLTIIPSSINISYHPYALPSLIPQIHTEYIWPKFGHIIMNRRPGACIVCTVQLKPRTGCPLAA